MNTKKLRNHLLRPLLVLPVALFLFVSLGLLSELMRWPYMFMGLDPLLLFGVCVATAIIPCWAFGRPISEDQWKTKNEDEFVHAIVRGFRLRSRRLRISSWAVIGVILIVLLVGFSTFQSAEDRSSNALNPMQFLIENQSREMDRLRFEQAEVEEAAAIAKAEAERAAIEEKAEAERAARAARAEKAAEEEAERSATTPSTQTSEAERIRDEARKEMQSATETAEFARMLAAEARIKAAGAEATRESLSTTLDKERVFMKSLVDSLQKPQATLDESAWIASALSTKIGSMVLLVLLVQILASIYRYDMQLASFYASRADYFQLQHSVGNLSPSELLALVGTEGIEISKTKTGASLDFLRRVGARKS